ncbi:MAG: hypothetical protein PHO55_06595 [Thiomonas arsenitoxydans]|nr:hypothetical protein [Thiomonas arsenitoxydans]
MNTASLILIVFAFFVLLLVVSTLIGTLIAFVLWRRPNRQIPVSPISAMDDEEG